MKDIITFLTEREIKATKSKPLTKEELKQMIKNNEDITYVNTSKITNMNELFKDNKNIIHIDLSNWDTSNVTSMSDMFKNCSNLESVIFGDTSSLKDMWRTFYLCVKLEHIEITDISKVNEAQRMFYGCKEFKQDLNDWKVPMLADKIHMFSGSGLEHNPPKWYKD